MPALAHVIEIYPGIDGTPSTRVLGSHCRPRYRIASVWLPVNANSCCRTATRRNTRSEEHTSELQSQSNLVCRLLLEKKKKKKYIASTEYMRMYHMLTQHDIRDTVHIHTHMQI